MIPSGDSLLATMAGNETARAMLEKAAAGRPFHAYLITGPAGAGKKLAARLLSAALVCQSAENRPCGVCPACRKVLRDGHPDVITVWREGKKSFLVGQARSIRQDAFIRPNEAEYKVYILPDAAAMDVYAQNALLKLLEEPPSYTVLALLCERAGQMLETVRSRCLEMPMAPLDQATMSSLLAQKRPDTPKARRDEAILASNGSVGRVLALLEEPSEVEKTACAVGEALAQADEYALYKAFMKTERYTSDDFGQVLLLLAGFLRDAVLQKGGGSPDAGGGSPYAGGGSPYAGGGSPYAGAGLLFPQYADIGQKLSARFSYSRLQALYEAVTKASEQSRLFMPGGNLSAATAAALYQACRRTLSMGGTPS